MPSVRNPVGIVFRAIGVVLFALCLFRSEFLSAEPRWQIGLGLGSTSLPDYRGSDEQQAYQLPIPYVYYRGRHLTIDKESGRIDVLHTGRFKIDFSLGASPPDLERDNRARRGMPPLEAALEIGPSLEYWLLGSDDDTRQLKLVLPYRLVGSGNFDGIVPIGTLFAPYLQYKLLATGELALSVGPLWASEDYHDYYYQVDTRQETFERPAYDAHGGYSGSRITITYSQVHSRLWYGGFIRYDRLDDAAFVDSPLLRRSDSLMAGIGVAWILAQSTTTR